MAPAHVVYEHITLHQCNTSYKMTYTEHVNQQTGIMKPIQMFPRWHQFQLSNFKKTGNVHTMSDSGIFRSLHSRPFTDGHTMQFTAVPLVMVRNCGRILRVILLLSWSATVLLGRTYYFFVYTNFVKFISHT